ncbi:hypothetical protein C8J57DRAFT_1338828 [Mycena rebaudengoi]|nr:hypothetical protein C8J57DRAFT_1338828 [Mycena rebaudengoi]
MSFYRVALGSAVHFRVGRVVCRNLSVIPDGSLSARDAPTHQPRKIKVDCQNCGKRGHLTVNCPLPERCSVCKGTDHLRNNCPKRFASVVCRNCKQRGHNPQLCPNPKARKPCSSCGSTDPDHKTLECDLYVPPKQLAKKCIMCGEHGHWHKKCPQILGVTLNHEPVLNKPPAPPTPPPVRMERQPPPHTPPHLREKPLLPPVAEPYVPNLGHPIFRVVSVTESVGVADSAPPKRSPGAQDSEEVGCR